MENQAHIGGEDRLNEAEKRLGYTFRNRDLLARALRHPSSLHEQRGVQGDNQRLEFLGDAVLGLLAADALYAAHQHVPEGDLTVLRAHLVNGKALATIARRLELGPLLEVGRGEGKTGGRTRTRNLADTLEALAGAVWLDGGLEAARALFERLIGSDLSSLEAVPAVQNPKGALQELCQHRWRDEPVYSVLARTGKDHAPLFHVSVHLKARPELRAEGEGNSRQTAEVEAATRLLAQLDA